MVLEKDFWSGSDSTMISRTASLQLLSRSDAGLHSTTRSPDQEWPLNSLPRKRSRSHNQMAATEQSMARLSRLDVKPIAPTQSLEECKKTTKCGRKSENQEPAVEEECKEEADDGLDNQCEEEEQHQRQIVDEQEEEEEEEEQALVQQEESSSSHIEEQRIPSRNSITATSVSSSNSMVMMQRICEELLQTEKSYVEDLQDLIRLYYQPLRHYAVKHEIELGAMSSLCSSSEIILGIHEELLRLLSRLDDASDGISSRDSASNDPFGRIPGSLGSVTIVSEALVATIEYMKVYSVYCTWFVQAQEELALLQRRGIPIESFSKMLHQVALKTQDVDIASNMIKPAQRICHYSMFLRRLLKNATTKEETLLLQQTLSRVGNISNQVNEKVRQMQNNNRLMEIFRSTQDCFGVELLSPARKLLHETSAYVRNLDAHHIKFPFRRNSACLTTMSVARPSMTGSTAMEASARQSTGKARTRSRRKSGEKLSLILLSDVLLMAKRKDRRFKVKRQLCLCCAIIHDNTISPPSGDNVHLHQQQVDENNDDDDPRNVSFQLEAFKVGRCQCHQVVPSVSKKQQTKGGRARVTSRSSCPFPRGKFKARRWLSAREFSFASARRYLITCDDKPSKDAFMSSLRAAVNDASQVMFPLAKNVAGPLEIPTRLWKTLTNDLSSVFLQSTSNECDLV